MCIGIGCQLPTCVADHHQYVVQSLDSTPKKYLLPGLHRGHTAHTLLFMCIISTGRWETVGGNGGKLTRDPKAYGDAICMHLPN